MRAILTAVTAAVLLLACGSQPAKTPTATEVPPRAESLVQPAYPEEARKAGVVGTSIVEVTVGADGAVMACSLVTSSASSDLDQAALNAARSSKFSPGTKDGKPVVMKVRVPFEFKLEDKHSGRSDDAQDVRGWAGQQEPGMGV
jgi:protein TonB